jgi:hypothetical protein
VVHQASPDGISGARWTRPLTGAAQPALKNTAWTMSTRLRIWRSGGRAGRCRRLRSGSGRTWLRWCTVVLPAVQRGRCRSVRMPLRRPRVSAVPERAGSRCPAGHLRYPHVRAAGTSRLRRPGPLDQRRRASPTRTALPSRRNGGCGSAAVLPQPAGQPDTAAAVQVVAEPDTAAAVSACCCFRNNGRCPDGWSLSGRLVSAADTSAASDVRCYRNRSPGRRPLDGCRHR